MEEIIIKANPENFKVRLDKFLSTELSKTKPEVSRKRIQDLISLGNVSNDGIIINSADYKVKGTENFIIKIPAAKPSEISAKKIDFEIIFEDENMLVINKPAGLTTHPGAGNQEDTLVNALLFSHGESLSGINGIARPGIVHRLDRDTSGLMVVAKNDRAHQELAKQIQDRTLKRYYLALCFGVPKPLKGTINKNLGRSKVNRLKMAIMRLGGRTAITNYEVKEIYLNGAVSMVECQLDTGRTHQIRVHMTSIGHSIIGDQTYGNSKKLGDASNEIKNMINNFPRQALHSYKIAFLHPITQKEMEFEIDMPYDIAHLQEKLGG